MDLEKTFDTPIKPHVHVVVCGTKTESFPNLPTGFLKIEFDGNDQTSAQSLFENYMQKLSFPDYFGRNWNAFNDCITDLEWLDANGFVLVTNNAEALFCDEESRLEQLDALTGILVDAGKAWGTAVDLGEPWDRPPVPFHSVFRFQDETKAKEFEKIVESNRE